MNCETIHSGFQPTLLLSAQDLRNHTGDTTAGQAALPLSPASPGTGGGMVLETCEVTLAEAATDVLARSYTTERMFSDQTLDART